MILLVDDDKELMKSNLRALSHYLEGHALMPFTDPLDALRFVTGLVDVGSEEELELLVTDYHMPGMNGVELATLVRKLIPTVPILFLSGASIEAMGEFPNSLFKRKGGRIRDLVKDINELLGDMQ